MIGRTFFKFVCFTLLTCPFAVLAADWPMKGHDPSRNAVVPGELPPDWDLGDLGGPPERARGIKPRNIKWSVPLGSWTNGAPVVADGHVYVGTNNTAAYLKRYPADVDLGCLLCFRESDGKFLWQYSAEKLPTGRMHDWPMAGLGSSPLVEGDRLWLVSNRYEVLCLDAKGFLDGENDGPYRDEKVQADDEADIVWRYDLIKELGVSPHNAGMGPNKRCCPSASYQNRIYIVTENGPDEGHTRIPAPQAPSLVCFDKDSGKVLWTDNSPGENILHTQVSDPLVAEIAGRCQVIVGQGDGWIRSFDAITGEVIWQFDINFKDSLLELGGRGTRSEIMGTPVFYKGRVYVGSGQDVEHGEGPGRLVCIDPTKTGDISSQLAVDSEGRILPIRRRQAVVAENRERAIPNPNSGMIWEYTTRDSDGYGTIAFLEEFHRTISSVAIKDDLLLACDLSGAVHCLDAQSGKVHWTYDLLAACWSGPLIVGNQAVVADEDGDLAYFTLSADPRTALPENEPSKVSVVNRDVLVPLVFANDVLYVTSRNRLFAISADKAADEKKQRINPEDSPDIKGKSSDAPRRTPKSVFAPTPHDVVEAMLKAANVRAEDTVVDLGSGDGRIVLAAAQKFGATAVGYELDWEFVALSRVSLQQAKVGDRAQIKHEDMYTADLSDARVVTAYLFPGSLEKLKPQLRKLPEGALIVTHHYAIPEVEPADQSHFRSQETGNDHRIYLYRVPLKESHASEFKK